MKNAGAAMKQIHNGLTIDKVDATMDELREQHALGEEIASAITNAPIGEPIDEADLEEELEGLEQEAMDERMLKTGTVPVTGEVNRLPAVGNGPGMFPASPFDLVLVPFFSNLLFSKLFPSRLAVEDVTDPFQFAVHNPQEEDEEEELRKLQAEMAM